MSFTPLARKLAALDEAGPDDRGFYRACPDGGYELHPTIAEIADREEPRLQAREAEREELCDRCAEDVRTLAGLRITEAVERAMRAAGVPLGDVEGAAEHFGSRFDLTVQEGAGGPTVCVRDQFGETALSFAVASFLQTREGSIFCGDARHKRTEEGPHSAALRQLRSRLQ